MNFLRFAALFDEWKMQVLDFLEGLHLMAMYTFRSSLSQSAFKTLLFIFVYKNLEGYFVGLGSVRLWINS